MKTKIILFALILILGTFVFSCGVNQPAENDSLDVDSIRTQAVSTFASSLTETLVAVPTAFSTRTVKPTVTTTAITETSLPTATTNPCYNLLYIQDVTIPDGTKMKVGEVFTKTWLIQNIGGCAWRAGFTFQHVGGELMRGTTVVLTEAIPTGAKREISVELVVPSGLNGLIQSSWRMADESGVFFGDTLSVNILVGSIATSTP